MSLQYSCFVSYRHGRYRLMRRFIDQLVEALKDYVEPYVALPVFEDRTGLTGGDLYEQRFTEILPRCVCMIAVYTPTYFDHNNRFCAREYRGMEIIEERRLTAISGSDVACYGMIIPIILKGVPPPRVAEHRDCRYDFTRFTLRSDDLSHHEQYADWFDQIGQHIRVVYERLQGTASDPIAACDPFRLPTEQEIEPFLNLVAPCPASLPGRVPSPVGEEP